LPKIGRIKLDAVWVAVNCISVYDVTCCLWWRKPVMQSVNFLFYNLIGRGFDYQFGRWVFYWLNPSGHTKTLMIFWPL